MNRNAIASVFVAALVLLAGCSAGTGSGGDVTTDGSATAIESTSGSGGTVNLYISDQPNDIDDFEHLNVTITRVGLKPAGEDDGMDDADEEDEASEDVENETESADDEAETTATATATSTEEADDADDTSDEWVEYEVDNRTVDLTELKGANATRLSSFDVPNGSYEKVFVHVSSVEGTLTDGSSQRVKLPSGKLQLNSEFTVGDGEEVDFVFDITAVEAGGSGKYVLKPVISESGTDVEIESIDDEDADDENDEDERGEEADDRPDDESAEREESALNLSFAENVTRGENATLTVTRNGSAVANASVSVNDEDVGTTDADGAVTFLVPDDTDELEVSVTDGDAEGELELEFASDSASGSGQSNGDQAAAA